MTSSDLGTTCFVWDEEAGRPTDYLVRPEGEEIGRAATRDELVQKLWAVSSELGRLRS
jgi:hypothetical protein